MATPRQRAATPRPGRGPPGSGRGPRAAGGPPALGRRAVGLGARAVVTAAGRREHRARDGDSDPGSHDLSVEKVVPQALPPTDTNRPARPAAAGDQAPRSGE